jgi:hypothetical protein
LKVKKKKKLKGRVEDYEGYDVKTKQRLERMEGVRESEGSI